MPLGGEPADVVARINSYDEWLAASIDVPKLLLTFQPGFGTMMGPELIGWCAANIASLDIDGAGVIDAVGLGVDAARIGERVWMWDALVAGTLVEPGSQCPPPALRFQG
jgi:hypothetical protein